MLKIISLILVTTLFFVFFVTSIIEGKVYAELWLERKINANIDNTTYFTGYLRNVIGAIIMLSCSLFTGLLLIKEFIRW